MPHLLLPKDAFRRLIRRRRAWGADHHDEVWNGAYVMAPDADNEHQALAYQLTKAIDRALDESEEVKAYPSINVTDQSEKWTKNYRCPDVAVFLPGNPAEDRGSHWYGGPDFAVEIVSKGDRSRQKLEFYAKVGVKELLLIDRNPWRLELYRNRGGVLLPVGVAELDPTASILVSAVLPISFRLTPAEPRPRILVTQTVDGRTWTI
jgi:Uma2 family endonuclease